MSLRGDIYRAHAAECEATAAAAMSDPVRATFAELAAQWRNLARQTETLERDESEAQRH
jgi:hypothetical protein